MKKLLKIQIDIITEKADLWPAGSSSESTRAARGEAVEWDSLSWDDWTENLDCMKQKLDNSDIADVVPLEKKRLSHALTRFLQHDEGKGKLAEGADPFSWVDVSERLYAFLKKKNEKKLEEQIAAAAQHNSNHLLKEMQKMLEKQDRGNKATQELCGELRGMKRSLDDFTAAISNSGQIGVPDTTDLAQSD